MIGGVVLLVQHRSAAEQRLAIEERLNRLSTLWMQVIERKRDLRALKVKPERAREALEQAVRELDGFIAANPNLPQGWYLRARGKLYLGRRDEARADARHALELAPDLGLAHALLGMILMEEAMASLFYYSEEQIAGNVKLRSDLIDAAAREFAVWKAGPDRSGQLGLASTQEDEVMGVLAALPSKWGNPAAAVADLRRAVDERHSEEYAVWLTLIVAEHEQETWLNRALEWAPGYGCARLMRARDRQRAGAFDAAIADYDVAALIEPQDPNVYINRGVVRHAKGDRDGAIGDYTRAIAVSPRAKYAYMNRALSRIEKGEFDGAVADFTEVITIDGRQKGAHMGRGVARRAKGDIDGAIADWTEEIGIDPRNADAHYRRGNARQAKRDPDGAIADWSAAISIDPRHKRAYLNRGLAREERGELDTAIADFGEAILIDPRDADAYVRRCHARQAKGDLAGVMADGEKALEVAPPDWPYRAQIEAMLKFYRERKP